MSNLIKKSSLLSYLVVFAILVLSGCAAKTSGTGPGKELTLDQSYKYKIEEIVISGEKQYEVDVKEILRSSLDKALADRDLLWDESLNKRYYGISLRIVEYEMGNAFKRWLLPTYGSTVLSVHTDIVDSETGEIVTYMEHKQTIAAGGLYSVGAWKYIFGYVSKDIAVDLERKYSGGGDGFFIQLDPWLEKEKEAPKVATIKKNIYLASFHDDRPEKNRIGERKAAFNVSMGDIYANRDVLVYSREALQNELLATGNSLSEDKFEITLNGDLLKFWVWTDTTALYWDIIGEIELKLTASISESGNKTAKTYKATSKTRTYVYPTKTLVETVVHDTIKSLMYQIRDDNIWNTL
jgi:uncharacterized lipoprotein YajG